MRILELYEYELNCVEYLFNKYLRIVNSNKAERAKKRIESNDNFICEMPATKKKAYEELSSHLKYLNIIAEKDKNTELLMKNQCLFHKLLKILLYFKKEKHFEIKTLIYIIFSKIFTLDKRHLENLISDELTVRISSDIIQEYNSNQNKNEDLLHNIYFFISNVFVGPTGNASKILLKSDIVDGMFEKIKSKHSELNEKRLLILHHSSLSDDDFIKMRLLKVNFLPFLFEIKEDSHKNNSTILDKALETLKLILTLALNCNKDLFTIMINSMKRSILPSILEKLCLSNKKNVFILANYLREILDTQESEV